ncbi:hypothetical protein U8335_26755 [Roseiconus lacunae]|uniref:hypothetical protein n=1 Tax=Roseiconus lacunae TaxID=2605694 RepID=UPI0030871BB0|nr:hypothetical protein U8335_26755 [Stieleria sp. HD01]
MRNPQEQRISAFEDEVRTFLRSDRGKLIVSREARGHLFSLLALWAAVLGVTGIASIAIFLAFVKTEVTKVATKRAMELLQEDYQTQIKIIDRTLDSQLDRISRIGESSAVESYKLRSRIDQLSIDTKSVAERSTRLSTRLSEVQESIDSDDKVALIEAINVLDEHQSAEAILKQLNEIQSQLNTTKTRLDTLIEEVFGPAPVLNPRPPKMRQRPDSPLFGLGEE